MRGTCSTFAAVIATMALLYVPAAAKQGSDQPLIAIEAKAEDGFYVAIRPLSKHEQKFARGLDKFANCVVQDKNIEIEEVFLSMETGFPNSFDNLGKKNSRKLFEACLSGTGVSETSGDIDLYIARFAQALYLRDFPTMPDLASGDMKISRVYPRNQVYKTIFNFADCVTLKNPSKVDAFLRTVSGTTEEHTILGELKPHYLSCLPPRSGIDSSSIFVRGGFALSLYARASRWTTQ